MPDWIAALDWKDAVGILGSLFISGAYLGVLTGKLDGERPPFQALNLLGAVMILFSLWFRPNAGAIMIEVLWIGIAVYSLAKFYRRRSGD
ncbi:MAG: hypothetical protein AAF393_15280 [Pseudomonadota bacterium]